MTSGRSSFGEPQVILGVALCFALLLLAGADKAPRTIEAEKVVLLDSRGRAKLTIATPALAD
jgi:hypothetical protein